MGYYVKLSGVVASGIVFLVDPAFSAPLSINLTQSFADTKAILASGGTADIVFLGDSLAFREGSFLPVFRTLLQAHYGNAGPGYQGFSLWTGGAMNAGWVRDGINIDMTPHHSLDGLWSQYDGVTVPPNQAYFHPTGPTVELHYLRQPGGGSFQILDGLDGSFVATIGTNAQTTSVESFAYTLPAGQDLYTIQPQVDGPVTILGQNNIRNAPGVRVHRGANGGWGVANFLQRDFTFDAQLNLLSADLVMVMIGQNDQGYSFQGYRDALNDLVDRVGLAVPNAEFVFVSTYDSGSTPIPILVEAMASVAQQRSVGFINIFAAAGDNAFLTAQGYIEDGVHFSPAGGDYIGHILYDAFDSDGVSLTPEPGAGAAVLSLGSLAQSRRGRRSSIA